MEMNLETSERLAKAVSTRENEHRYLLHLRRVGDWATIKRRMVHLDYQFKAGSLGYRMAVAIAPSLPDSRRLVRRLRIGEYTLLMMGGEGLYSTPRLSLESLGSYRALETSIRFQGKTTHEIPGHPWLSHHNDGAWLGQYWSWNSIEKAVQSLCDAAINSGNIFPNPVEVPDDFHNDKDGKHGEAYTLDGSTQRDMGVRPKNRQAGEDLG